MSENETSEGEGSTKRAREGFGTPMGQGSHRSGPQSESAQNQFVGTKVDAPGGSASPTAARAASYTKRVEVDMGGSLPKPAIGQLTGPRIGEPGDVSTGPGTNEVDTGGADTGNVARAPGLSNNATESPVMGVSRTVRRKLRPGA